MTKKYFDKDFFLKYTRKESKGDHSKRGLDVHIHISEKVLKKTKFSIEKLGDRLKIQGYNEKEIEKEACTNCRLKKFKNNETIKIDELVGGKECSCKLTGVPLMSLKVDLKKTKTITIV